MVKINGYLTRDNTRKYFNNLDLNYNIITEIDIRRLMNIVDRELLDYLDTDKGKQMNMRLSNLKKKDIKFNKDGLEYAYLKIDGSYFKEREAISFNRNGFIGFAGSLDDDNTEPILNGFYEWCEYLEDKLNKRN